MAKKRNIIVGQSGGPTAAINSSLAGVYKNAIERGFDKVYGMLHGIQGLMDEQYVDLSTQIHSELDIELLKRTPSAFLGSCRYKLPEIHEDREIYEKIFGILNKLEIDTFIYIGGNDSMDTIKKLSDYAIITGQSQKFLGVPKTIDNDLALTDHTPGFGSAAKYIGASTKEVIRDAQGLTYKKNMITIMEIMGRNAGWLTGATALAKSEDCDGPDLIYLPEVPFDIDKFLKKVKELLNKKSSIVIAVSEGIKLADGRYVCELGSVGDYVDAFGHKQLQGTATYLANFLAAECGCKTRAVELSTLQRSASHMASRVDIDEAFMVGGAAVKAADESPIISHCPPLSPTVPHCPPLTPTFPHCPPFSPTAPHGHGGVTVVGAALTPEVIPPRSAQRQRAVLWGDVCRAAPWPPHSDVPNTTPEGTP